MGRLVREQPAGTRSNCTATYLRCQLPMLRRTGAWHSPLSPKAPGKGERRNHGKRGRPGMHPCQKGCPTWGDRGRGLGEGLYKRKQQQGTAVRSLTLHLEQEVLLGSFSSFLMMTIILFWEEKPALTVIKNFTIF